MNVACPVCDRWKLFFPSQTAPAVVLSAWNPVIGTLNIQIVMEWGEMSHLNFWCQYQS